MEYGKYYKVPADKLASVLTELGRQGFKWRELGGGSPMITYYRNAISRDYGEMTPVLEVEIYKHYKFIKLTTDYLIENTSCNLITKPIYEFEELIKLCDLGNMEKEYHILACPFCGSEAEIENDFSYFRVQCKKGHKLDHWSDSIYEAIDVWNERTIIYDI